MVKDVGKKEESLDKGEARWKDGFGKLRVTGINFVTTENGRFFFKNVNIFHF